MKTLLLIDGNAIMHRAFHAIPPLTSANGTPTNAIYGFFNMLHAIIGIHKPYYVAVCFDTPKPTFRSEMFKEYQAQRPSLPDEFRLQIPHIQALLDTGGIARLEKDGFEADDIIGTLSYQAELLKNTTLILTGDKDIFQLVTNHTHVITPKIGISQTVEYDTPKVIEKMGVRPEQIPDYKALAGDPSDNYKGVKGIGPKTAAGLLSKYESIEILFENILNLDNERIRNALIEHKDNIIMTKKLATIVRDVQVPIDFSRFEFTGYKPAMKDYLTNLQAWSVIKRYFPVDIHQPKTQPPPVPRKKNSSNQPQLF